MGRRRALLRTPSTTVELSERHSEIALLLSWHRAGLSAEALARHLERAPRSSGVVRAEVRRLREVLPGDGPALRSRPYAFASPPGTDAAHVLELVRRGELPAAVRRHAGGVLPGSDAPGVHELRDEVALRLRSAVLAEDSPTLLLELARSPENRDDGALWAECVRRLPRECPGRHEAERSLRRIDHELGLPVRDDGVATPALPLPS